MSGKSIIPNPDELEPKINDEKKRCHLDQRERSCMLEILTKIKDFLRSEK